MCSSSDSSSLSFSASEYISAAATRTAGIGRPVSPFRASKIYIDGNGKKNTMNSNRLPEGGHLVDSAASFLSVCELTPAQKSSHKMTLDKSSTSEKNVTKSSPSAEGGLMNLSHKMTPDKLSTTPKKRKIVKKFSLSALRAKLPFSRSPDSAPAQQGGSSPGSDGYAFIPTCTSEREYCAEGERLRLLSIQRQQQGLVASTQQAAFDNNSPRASYGYTQHQHLRNSLSPAVSPPAVSGPWMASPHAPYTSSPLVPAGRPYPAAQSVRRPPSRRSSDPYHAVAGVNSPWFSARGSCSKQAPSGSPRPSFNNAFNSAGKDIGSYSVAMEGDDIFEDDLPTPRRVPSVISPFLLSRSPCPSSPDLTTPPEAITTPSAGKRKSSNRNYYGARSGAQRESTRATWGPETSRSTSDVYHLFSRPSVTVQPSQSSSSVPLRSSQSMASLRNSGSPSLGRASERLTRSLPRKSVNALGISYDPDNEVFIAEEDEEVERIRGFEKEKKKRMSEKEKKEEREMSLEYHRSLNKMNKGYSYVPSA